MLFNSIDFAFFLPLIFVLYWFVVSRNLKLQNTLILAASYLFYGWWDWRFISLIAFSTLVDFAIGLSLKKSESNQKRKILLWLSLLVNLGFLGIFKYYNFFVESFVSAFSFFGQDIQANTLNIILPVGISFYTFQTLSYTIDVYKRKLEPSSDLVAFAAFVSFFPQLVAGPIERAKNLLPQFYKKRVFNYSAASDGMKQILWGLFKKVVIADNCAEYADLIFNNSEVYSGSTLVLGAVFFAFQIYGDFSGYSDIAIGTARLFGFDLKQNFAFPYFSRDIAEFWRRWHISLSTWFRDYLYIPLGGSRGGTTMKIRNTFIIFVVSGFWHGANWTFIVWGLLNAIYFLPLLLFNRNRQNMDIVAQESFLPNLKELVMMFTTFCLTVFAWIFFRAEDLKHAFQYIGDIFDTSIFSIPEVLPKVVVLFIIILICTEWVNKDKQHGLQFEGSRISIFLKWFIYILYALLIAFFFGKGSTFIYFQF